jgi:hypothetical protein
LYIFSNTSVIATNDETVNHVWLKQDSVETHSTKGIAAKQTVFSANPVL